MSRTQILAIGVDKVTMQEAVDRCLAWMETRQPHLVVTPNAEIAYAATHDPSLAEIINKADLVIADGAGVVLGAKILGDPVPEKVAGVNLSTNLLKAMSQRGRGRIYLLGARPESVAKAVESIRQNYPGVTLAGYHDGFFTPEEEPAILEEIRKADVDLLVVGLGSPRQERWLHEHLPRLGARVGIGAGGTIDTWAGISPRAPEWMIKANLEWLFRVVKLGRYSRSLPPLFKFALAVFARRLRGR